MSPSPVKYGGRVTPRRLMAFGIENCPACNPLTVMVRAVYPRRHFPYTFWWIPLQRFSLTGTKGYTRVS
jgi:hypothetical protein